MTKEEFLRELRSQAEGLPDSYLECIVDQLDRMGFEFRRFGTLSPEENREIEQATESCVSTSTGVTQRPR